MRGGSRRGLNIAFRGGAKGGLLLFPEFLFTELLFTICRRLLNGPNLT